MKFTGESILITGAAGRIGSSVSRLCLQSGATVVLADLELKNVLALTKDLSDQYPGKVKCVEANVATSHGIDAMLEEALRHVDRIDKAVHCAYPISPGWGSRFEDLAEQYLNQDLAMQLGGAILFSQKIIKLFKGQGGGGLVHIASIQGVQAPKFEHYEATEMTSPIEYTAIKAGVIAMTRWLAKYNKNLGIRVNCVSPGGILDSQPESFLNRYRKSCTNIGMLSAEQVATAVVFLLSAESSAINGQNIIVDDGWTL